MKSLMKKIFRSISPLYKKTDDLQNDLQEYKDENAHLVSSTVKTYADYLSQALSASEGNLANLTTGYMQRNIELQLKLHEDSEILAETVSILNLWNQYEKKTDVKPEKIFFFKYACGHDLPTMNLGDNVQTIAARAAALSVTEQKNLTVDYIDRDELAFYHDEPALAVMQGWFSSLSTFLPSPDLRPVFAGVHFSRRAQKVIKALFRQKPGLYNDWEIGCRDLQTLKFCQKSGIKSYFSRCLTLTLPKREKTPQAPKIFFVDLPEDYEQYIPEGIKRDAVRICQREYPFDADILREHPELYIQLTERLLKMYREEAGLIVTSAIHCTMPAIAVGIPVVFIAPCEEAIERSSAMINLIPINTFEDLKNGTVDFAPSAPDIEPLKQLLRQNLFYSISIQCGETVNMAEVDKVRTAISQFSCIENPIVPEQKQSNTDLDSLYLDLFKK